MDPILFLSAFHLLFFGRLYLNPLSMARSELLSTFFPTWIWQGRQWLKGKAPKYEPYYWVVADAHPVLATYYPVQILASVGAKILHPDSKFCLFLWCAVSHFLFASVGWFSLVSTWNSEPIALFAAITFTYASYNIKQQPAIIYTVSWLPWLLLGIVKSNIWLAGFSFGMILLAGYYPIGIQAALISVFVAVGTRKPLMWVPIGLLIGLPQLVPFLKYLPRTIRANAHDGIGKVPWWHFISLIFPRAFRRNINGVGYWEMTCFGGGILIPLAAYGANTLSIAAVTATVLLCVGFGSRHLPRIPARWLYTLQVLLCWMAVCGLSKLNLPVQALWILVFIQAFDLFWHNAELLPTHPYSELPKRPSWAFKTKLTEYLKGCKDRISGLPYPLFTGHINELKTLGYNGGMQLKLMAKWRKDSNPNGSGNHDWFKTNEDEESLDRARVRYAYTTQKLDWRPTPIKRLWENPRLSGLSG